MIHRSTGSSARPTALTPPHDPAVDVLEQLRVTARDRERQAAVERLAERVRRDVAEQRLAPALRALEHYFRDLARCLEAAGPEIRVSYEIPEIGTLVALRQGRYRLLETISDTPGTFGLAFDCTRDICVRTRVSTPLASVHRNRLRSYGLRFQEIDRGRSGTVFMVEGHVPVELRFDADPSLGVVVLQTRNLDTLGPVRFHLPPERIDRRLADELARCVLRQPNAFRELGGGTMTDADRAQLRARIAREQRRRDLETRRGILGGTARLVDALLRRVRSDTAEVA
ncbi:MAG: hypothetical protein H6983_09155 [Ectothiorhodospiraceae bacterium]|nr:hypothetical protein [Planctomycetota bacterium]MCP5151787.1 hypothetical protein [Chromatiales bacterium]MCP5154319.1 hypothetical protein [Ectothiorhodospiraceae bacterium]